MGLEDALQFSRQHRFESGPGVEHPVAEVVLDLVPQALDRVELRAGGGQGAHGRIVRQAGVAIPQVETGVPGRMPMRHRDSLFLFVRFLVLKVGEKED